MITVPKVLVIGADGEKLGVVDTDSALAMAEEEGLDLVEVSPHVSPPVCKILDYGKLKYQEQKKASGHVNVKKQSMLRKSKCARISTNMTTM